MKVDITIRERLVFPLENRPVLRGYKEYAELPRGARIRAYSLGEIASEKVVALMDRARNEPRDLYDVWYLARGWHVDLGDLVEAIEQKWEFRGLSLRSARSSPGRPRGEVGVPAPLLRHGGRAAPPSRG